jgi:hypothetical protein
MENIAPLYFRFSRGEGRGDTEGSPHTPLGEGGVICEI